MAKIGAAWNKKDKNGKIYISLSIEKAFKPLIIDDSKTLALFVNDRKETAEQPDYIFCMDIKETKDANKEDSEFPFV